MNNIASALIKSTKKYVHRTILLYLNIFFMCLLALFIHLRFFISNFHYSICIIISSPGKHMCVCFKFIIWPWSTFSAHCSIIVFTLIDYVTNFSKSSTSLCQIMFIWVQRQGWRYFWLWKWRKKIIQFTTRFPTKPRHVGSYITIWATYRRKINTPLRIAVDQLSPP
jgi:hypothetical protein